MTDSIDTRLGRIEQALERSKEDRRESRDEAREESKALLMRLDRMDQTITSTANAVANLGIAKLSERMTAAENALDGLITKTKNLPLIETEVMFWRRVLGGGFRAAWKLALFAVGSGGVGAATVKLVDWWNR